MTATFPFLALLITSFLALHVNNEKVTGYDLSKPDSIIELPDTLREISGITDIDDENIGCVQDENGVLFIYNFVKNSLSHQFTFNIDGDYEGITRVGDEMFILQSDGTIFEISNYRNPDFKLTSYSTNIPANDNEGLCYDAKNNRLLIACKGKVGKGPEFKDKRLIYGFDLTTKEPIKEPIFTFDVANIKDFAVKNNIDLPTKKSKKKDGNSTEPIIKLMTSAIGVHPLTNKLYLLSAQDHLFFIFNMDGEIEHIQKLDPKIFNKAEGITFLENNDMLITNEGQNGKATLLRFNYKN